MKKKRIYIAGPMTGLPEFNYPAFLSAEKHLKQLGYEVVNPVRIGDKYGTPEEINANPSMLEKLIKEELIQLVCCDAIYLLRGWEKSKGSRKELATAIVCDLEIIQEGIMRGGAQIAIERDSAIAVERCRVIAE